MIYVLVQCGITSKIIAGLTSDKEAAITKANELSQSDFDSYHIWTVYAFELGMFSVAATGTDLMVETVGKPIYEKRKNHDGVWIKEEEFVGDLAGPVTTIRMNRAPV